MIYALLCQESSSAAANQSVANYAIFEQWRGVKRPLKGRTKIIKVWRAWGSDSRNVKLFLCELDNNFDTSSEVSRNWHHRRRGSREKTLKGEKIKHDKVRTSKHESQSYSETKQKGGKNVTLPNTNNHGYSKPSKSLHLNEQTDRVRKSRTDRNTVHKEVLHTGTEEIQTRTTGSKVFSKSQIEEEIPIAAMRLREHAEYQELLHIIHEQETVINQQLAHLKETDQQIATHEQRSKARTQMEDSNIEMDTALFPNIKSNDMEAYLHMCDSILEIQDKIDLEVSQLDQLSTSLTEEREAQLSISDSVHPTKEYGQKIQGEVENIKKDLKRSITLSMAQQKQLQLVSETLNACEVQLRVKRQYIEHLTKENERLSSVETESKEGVDPCSSSGIESGIETSPEPSANSQSSQNTRFLQSGTNKPTYETKLGDVRLDSCVYISENSSYCHVEVTPKHKLDADNETEEDEVENSGKNSNLKGILKTKSQGYSVRFADEVNGNSDYVNFSDPCLTQVFEYSKYEGHNYVNVDDLDQGCYDDDDIRDDDIQWVHDRNKAYNVDTGELYYDEPPQCIAKPNSGMVPYRTYQVRTPDAEIVGTKTSSSDDNSDTGLSSMHSDDPIPPVLETLV